MKKSKNKKSEYSNKRGPNCKQILCPEIIKQYNINAEEELLKIFYSEMNESEQDFYKRIKDTLNIESFMKATNNNLEMLFNYMYSPTIGIRLSNIAVGKFIKDNYDDDFYYRREVLRCEEYKKHKN